MDKALVVYWSGTGNTEKMANAIAKGMQGAGVQVDVKTVSEIDAAGILSYEAIAFGCPSMGDEVLEESEFEPMFTEVEGSLGGKKVALFGPYGWGDGQWMRDWNARVENGNALLYEYLIQQEDALDEAACEAFGKAFAGQ